MKYRITHTTRYIYGAKVSLCHNLACLLPRETAWQRCLSSDLFIKPNATSIVQRWDFFANRLSQFTIEELHNGLEVTAISEVKLKKPSVDSDTVSMPWEQVRDGLTRAVESDDFPSIWDLKLFTLNSPFIQHSPQAADYAMMSFLPGRPIIEATMDLTRRIYHEFTYDPGFTTIATPVQKVLEEKRGVCQDFAHLAITCLRSIGLSARYVSGYLESIPPEGQEKLVGGDASHAWLAVFVPQIGWVDFDPTNNQMPRTQHITVAFGRDYGDVVPLKGIMVGGGNHSLEVDVHVEPLTKEEGTGAEAKT